MANWLFFDKIKDCEFIELPGFQYDHITDAQIATALGDVAIMDAINTAVDWEDDEFLQDTQVVNEAQKHAYRVAALVLELQNGGVIRNAIEMDSAWSLRCYSAVGNGHHRVRALQYMGLTTGPFAMSGSLDILENLVNIAGAKCPQELKKHFAPELCQPNKEDVRAPRRRHQPRSI